MYNLALHANHVAVIEQDGSPTTYAELDDLVTEFAARLGERRALLLLECSNELPAIVAYLACLKADCPVFLVTEGGATTEELLAKYPISFVYAKTNGVWKLVEHQVSPPPMHPELAVLLQTSGSTGASKGIRLSKTNLRENARSIIEYLDISAADRAITSLQFNYSYGLSVLNSHLLAGASVSLTNLSVKDQDFWNQFQRDECTSFAGVPYSYELLFTGPFLSMSLPSLRYATQAGGRLPPASVERLSELSRNAGWRFFVMYGQTEATARMAYLPPDMASENPECIGIAIPGGEFELLDDDGEVITASDTSGELIYRGPNVMMGYAENPADLALPGAGNVLHTGDIACRKPNGLYYVVGRKSRFAKPFGIRVSLDDVENRLSGKYPEVACVDVEDIICIATTAAERQAIIAEMSEWLKIPTSAINVHQVSKLPRRPNGKVDYVQLKKEFAAAHTGSRKPTAFNKLLDTFQSPKTVDAVFRKNLGITSVPEDASFVNLGGDSLSYINTSMELERILGRLPDDWENLSVAELQRHERPISAISWSPATVFLRAAAITAVVAGHFSLSYGGGGALLLLFLSGFSFGKFQLPDALTRNSGMVVVKLTAGIAIPTIAYLIFIQLYYDAVTIPSLLLFSNLIDPNLNPHGYSAWFIELLVQMLILSGIVLSFPQARQLLQNQYTALAWAFVAALALRYGVNAFWNTDHLYDRVPHMAAWVFLGGMWLAAAETPRQRILAGAAWTVACLAADMNMTPTAILIAGGLLVASSVKAPLPAIAARALAYVASASLFIYLMHYQFAAVARHVFDPLHPAAGVAVALLGGVIAFLVYDKVTTTMLSYWSENRGVKAREL